jgi:hypothetical protein
MKTIKYRGKRKDNGEWVEGSYLQQFVRTGRKVGILEYAYYGSVHEVIPDTVGQCTGLPDKGGRDIWEGDILFPNNRLVVWAEDGEGGSGVGFYTKCYAIGYGRSLWSFGITQAEASKVIGNIHDNPELLEKP